MISDVFRTATIIFFFIIQFFELRKKIIENGCIKALVDLGFYFNLLIIIIYFISLHKKTQKFHFLVDNIFHNVDLLDFNLLIEEYKLVFILESIFFCLISIKFLVFLKLNKNFGQVYSTIESAINIFVKYSIFYFIFIIGYAILFYILFGPYLLEFSDLRSSIVQILLFTMGKIIFIK